MSILNRADALRWVRRFGLLSLLAGVLFSVQPGPGSGRAQVSPNNADTDAGRSGDKSAASQNAAPESRTSSPSGSDPASEGERPDDSRPPSHIMLLRLDGGIFSGTADYLIKNVQAAEAQGVPVLLELDTPGGALDATRDIVKAFMSARVPIIVWVGPSGARAGSAGVFITMAANVASMAPGTNIGAAHPVGIGVGAPEREEKDSEQEGERRTRSDQELMAEKVENDTLAFIEAIATTRNRNKDWALLAVKESASITADKALELNVIDLLARDHRELLDAIDGREVQTAASTVKLATRGVPLVEVPMTLRQRFLTFLSDPNLVYILFALGMLGMYLEFNHPGLIVPAVVGGVCLLLALTGLSVLPYNASGLIFLLVAAACFVAELYVGSFGLLALGGAASLVLAAILLFEDPAGMEGLEGLQVAVSPLVYGTVAVLALAFVLPIAYLVARAQTRKVSSGKEGMVGTTGKALTEISHSEGKIFVLGEYWDARSALPIAAGQTVVVKGVRGLILEVLPQNHS